MHWFGGSIAEAVNLSKQKNAIFVVFVEGENDQSAEMVTTLDDAAIAQRLSDEGNFLAIKLKSGSPTYTHFAQIYQFVPVPSLFFIGRNGTPLEVVCAGVQPDNLASRIDRILEEHREYMFVADPSLFFIGRNGTPLEVVCAGVQPDNLASRIDRILEERHKEKPFLAQPSTSSQDVIAQTSSLLQAEAAANVIGDRKTPLRDETPETSSATAPKVQKTEQSSSSQEYEVVCAGDVCVRRPKSQEDPGPSQLETTENKTPEATATESAASIEEKMKKAKELIEIRRREKAEKEKELERQKELERRSAGQGVTELKQWQADQEMKQLQEDRKREKMEDSLARQRVLEQIAQDRAERRARETPTAQPAQPISQPHANPNTSGDATGRARIQFKLPDGSSHTAHFEADNTLATVQTYVSDNLNLPTISFALWMAFPRRELTEGSSTLRELQLAPSAALLVLPRSSRAVSEARPGFNIAFITTFLSQLFTSLIYEPSTQLWAWVRGRLFGAPPPRAQSPPSADPPRTPPSTLRYRPRTNIHRLNGDRGSDDENNTWNGNSTQQM